MESPADQKSRESNVLVLTSYEGWNPRSKSGNEREARAIYLLRRRDMDSIFFDEECDIDFDLLAKIRKDIYEHPEKSNVRFVEKSASELVNYSVI